MAWREILLELGTMSRAVLGHGLDAFADAYPETPREQLRGARERILRFFEDAAADKRAASRRTKQPASARKRPLPPGKHHGQLFCVRCRLGVSLTSIWRRACGMSPHVEDPSALLGRNFFEVFPYNRGTPIEQAGRRAMSEGVMAEFEMLYEPWDRWYYGRCFPVQDGGLAVYFRETTRERQGRGNLARG